MPDPVLPLQDLSRQINQHETQLERLRREYQSRQAKLTDLTRRKEALQGQLQEVEAEIESVSKGKATAKAAPAAPAAPASSPKAGSRPKLSAYLVKLVRAAGHPVTAKELAEKLVQRKFPTKSNDVLALVHTRARELVKKGALRHAPDQPGFLPGQAAGEPQAPSSKAKAERPAKAAAAGKKSKSAKKAATRAKGSRPKGQPPLREVLTKLLQKSAQPLAARELTEQVLATGYQTTSPNLINSVWTMLGQMDNVENVAGKGYRLKKR